MQLQSLPPRPGKSFYLKVTGNHRLSKPLLGLAVLSTTVFLWSIFSPVPQVPASVTGPARIELMLTLQSIFNLLRIGTGLFALLAGLGVGYSIRSFSLHLEGLDSGGVNAEAHALPLKTMHFKPELGPYRVVILRKLRDDLPMSAVYQDHKHLFAVASEDTRGDSTLGEYLVTQVALVDTNGERTLLMSVPASLPENTQEVMEQLRAHSSGELSEVRGGGYQLLLSKTGATG